MTGSSSFFCPFRSQTPSRISTLVQLSLTHLLLFVKCSYTFLFCHNLEDDVSKNLDSFPKATIFFLGCAGAQWKLRLSGLNSFLQSHVNVPLGKAFNLKLCTGLCISV
ncbi:hypothetical protein AMECASPLE_007329 [Ameca splendens]|uniref:Uncharacterized protein n=1 Tax=Ameca splendens TaxID=208324 RepID=A0ABV0XCT5_9TELE